jgi:hypothetical protein
LEFQVTILEKALWIGVLSLGLGPASQAAGQQPAAAGNVPLKAATFHVDVTPPIGDGPCIGCMPKVARIEHPLELRGVILQAGPRTFLIAAIDFCGVCNTSDEAIRDAMARAAGTTRECVALQSLHQHSAPILDADAMRLLHGDGGESLAWHLRFTEDVSARATAAITAARQQLRPVSRVVGSKAKVDRVASNRRVPRPDGGIAVRASVTREADVRDAPEGLVDPWLRTVTFFDGARPFVQLHYYATHPQTFYGDARVSWDCVGMARDKLERSTGTFQIYFTGCGGNVTVGKYNDGTVQARDELANRLLDAMRRSSDVAAKSGPEDEDLAVRVIDIDVRQLGSNDIAWATAPIQFTIREDGAFHPKLLTSQLAPEVPFQTRLTAAMYSGFLNRLRAGYIAQASRLRIGDLDIIHLPGEPFVEFQLFAQQAAPRSTFVCVAGYGECGVWYYGPDSIYSDRGGYEQTWSVTGPCQLQVEAALDALLLRPNPMSVSPPND